MDDDEAKKNTEDPEESDKSDVSGESDKSDKPEESEKADGQKEPENSEKSAITEVSDTSDKSDSSNQSDTSDTSDESGISDSSDTSLSSEAPSEVESDSTESKGAKKEDDSSEQPTPAAPSLSKNDVPGAHWFVVHTYSGHEAKVAATLKQRVESQQMQDKVLDILVPTQEKIEIKEGKKNKVKEKIFPGYLLIRMILDDNTWLVVRTTPGITSFVGMGNKPTPLPEEEVASIQRFMSMEAPKFKASFSVGEAVKIVDGPFSEFLGSISEIDDERGKIKVLVSIFGRETPVELDFLQVAKL